MPSDAPPPVLSRSGQLEMRDIPPLLQLAGRVAILRSDPRTWRLELLSGINQLLPATSSACFVLKNVALDTAPQILSIFDAGFKTEARQFFQHEFNNAPFGDPLARHALAHFAAKNLASFTTLRSEIIDDQTWLNDPHVKTWRHCDPVGDIILSLQRGVESGVAYALLAFRNAGSSPVPAPSPSPPAPTPAATQLAAPSGPRFTPRDAAILDVLHAGISWIYREEESTHRLHRASDLSPRLRQTLESLLAGDTERQVALKMSLSVHTVHDYVKALYTHFGVSSRGELLAKWMQTGGQLPPPPRRDEP